MDIEERAVGSITPYESNPRTISEATITAVANSIREFGFRQPVVVDREGVIIVGHARWMAAQQLGLESVPVHVMDATPQQARAYRLADNRINEMSTWDIPLLSEEISALTDDFNLTDFGFNDIELELAEIDEFAIMSGEKESDPYDESPDEMITQKLRYKVNVVFGSDDDREAFYRLLIDSDLNPGMRNQKGWTPVIRIPRGQNFVGLTMPTD